MNSYDKKFFERFLPEKTQILWVIHRHNILIIDRIMVMLFGFVALPSFFYYQSMRFQELIPFYYFEGYLFLLFLKIVYDIFDWYNDVWIMTDDTLFDVRWSLFKSKVESVSYENIEWIEVEQNSMWDKLIGKGDLVVHKHGDDSLRITDIADPFSQSNILSELTHKEEAEPEKDRFELILKTLWSIVNDYLFRKWLTEEDILNNPKYNHEEFLKQYEHEERTIDLREKK